jgi:tetratricopeptide (TPR) repeat protein
MHLKIFFKIIMSLTFLYIICTILYFVILSLSYEEAQPIVSAITSILILLIVASIYGMIKGRVPMLNIRQRKVAILLFANSIFFLFYISALGLLNIILEKNSIEEIPSLKESILNVANLFIPIGYKEGLLTEKFGGITFRFPKGEEKSIQTIKGIYPVAKKELDKIYGKNSSDHFTIMIYETAEELNSDSNIEKVSGYYDSGNRSIHMISCKQMSPSSFQDLFFHEYTHYRTDQFLKVQNIPSGKIPQWFNEGISQFEMDLHTEVDLDLIKVINFTNIITNNDFHAAIGDGYDPYLQSYFAVKELVLEHGTVVIPNLIKASKNKNFYKSFQQITGSKIEEFQKTFLNRRKRVKELYKQADVAQKKKQYKNAENLYLEITHLDPSSNTAAQSLPNLYIKLGEFEKAKNQLESMDEPDVWELQILSELTLLTNPQESLKYAVKAEEMIKINTGDANNSSDLTEAVREVIKEPVEGYLLLFKKDLITYKEIRNDLYKKLRVLYPNDHRIQSLENTAH